MFICPNCQSLLTSEAPIWRCSNRHTFDIGKNGDVNLLLPQHKRSKSPGDSKEMVAARHDFLASNAYQPIAERLAKYVTLLSQGLPVTIVDAGCGEGYYLQQIKQLCYPCKNYPAQFIGWDISKFAVQMAAKQAKKQTKDDGFATWLTASNAHIPLADRSVDILLSLFGFEVADEFARVIKSGGFIITADAGENHLIEIRRLIYPDIKPYREKMSLTNMQLGIVRQESLCYQISLNSIQLMQLLNMTPHFFRAKLVNKEALLKRDELSVTVDVIFRIYQRSE